MVRTNARLTIATAGLLLFSVLASLGVAEAVMRAISRLRSAQVPPLAPELAGLPQIRSLFELATPNQRGVYKGHLYQTNSTGFRGREYVREKPSNAFRIVAIGDSFTMGDGVDEDQAYPALLEKALNTSGPGHYEVLNLGIAGFNVRHSLDRLHKIGLMFAPDLILYGFTINDLDLLPGYRHTEVPGEASPFQVVGDARLAWSLFRDLVWPPLGSYLYELNENFFDNPEVWGSFRSNLSELARVGRGRGDCVVVLIHTDLVHLGRIHPLRRHYEAVERAVAEQGMTAIQTLPFVIGRGSEGLTIGFLDPHPNPKGHRAFARALLEGLSSLPESCWKDQRPASFVLGQNP